MDPFHLAQSTPLLWNTAVAYLGNWTQKICYSTLKLFTFTTSCTCPFWAVKPFKPFSPSRKLHPYTHPLLSHSLLPFLLPKHTHLSTLLSPRNNHSWCNAGWGRKWKGGLPVRSNCCASPVSHLLSTTWGPADPKLQRAFFVFSFSIRSLHANSWADRKLAAQNVYEGVGQRVLYPYFLNAEPLRVALPSWHLLLSPSNR